MAKLEGILTIQAIHCVFIPAQKSQKYQRARLGFNSVTISQYVEILMAPMNANQEKGL